MDSRGMMVPLASRTSSSSRCVNIVGGAGSSCIAISSSRAHTGRTVGATAPRASSATAARNCTIPGPSSTVCCIFDAMMKPPHASLVTLVS
uniref:Uncharacterized protein n=1 Tax=Aegilops tauschii TaxID=37682 RepID=M8BV27_AEGTA